VVVGVAGGALWLSRGALGASSGATGGTASSSAEPGADQATAEVIRRTLEVQETFDGTLGYDGETDVVGGLTGVLTWLAPEGAVVGRGERLYETDGSNRASLMFGDRPAWRTMEAGVSNGADILRLEQNLQALGYTRKGDEIDRHWDADTTAAVKRWQKAKGLARDGVIQLGEVVFAPGPLRITEHKAALGSGSGPGGPLMSATSDRRIVTVDLAADDQTKVSVDQPVEIELPDGTTTAGKMASIGTVAQASTDQTGGQGTPTIKVEISLDDAAAAGSYDQAPVKVSVTTSSRPDVLTVPVNSLLALLEGGYAVEVADAGGATHLVAVEPGLFDDGLVEVRSDGLAEGDHVVVPS
jgi:peptidoglycan hydrolase-like protein with peptidoglycan-binding domain